MIFFAVLFRVHSILALAFFLGWVLRLVISTPDDSDCHYESPFLQFGTLCSSFLDKAPVKRIREGFRDDSLCQKKCREMDLIK